MAPSLLYTTSVSFLSETVRIQTRPSLSPNAISLLSGDQSRRWRMALPPLVSCRGALEPSCATIQISSSPLASEIYATLLPSGDQAGHLSCAPGVLVRLRVTPFSTGAEKMSPRALNSTRSPFGLRSECSIRLAAEMYSGRRLRPSSGTVIEIGVALPLLTSSTCSSPFNS